MKYKNNLVPLIIGVTILLTALLLYIKPLTKFFEFEQLNLPQLSISIVVGFVSVVWFELVKWRKRKTKPL
jgi:Ca2+-transporting ATPase